MIFFEVVLAAAAADAAAAVSSREASIVWQTKFTPNCVQTNPMTQNPNGRIWLSALRNGQVAHHHRKRSGDAFFWKYQPGTVKQCDVWCKKVRLESLCSPRCCGYTSDTRTEKTIHEG